MRAEAEAVQIPIDIPAVFSLGALAAVTGGHLRVRAWGGFEDASNLYTVVALPPGSVKSAVHKHVTAPLVALEERLQEEAKPDRDRALARRGVLEKRLKRAEDAAAKADTHVESKMLDVEEARRERDECIVPALPRLTVDDTTPEQLKTLLMEQNGRLAMISAESSLFGNIAGPRYSKDPNIEAVLAAWAGDRIEVDRRDRHEKIKDPRLTICIAVQPSVLRESYKNAVARNRGFFDRFLFSVPRSNIGERDLSTIPPEVSPMVVERWAKHLQGLADLRTEPMTIALSPEALESFCAFRAAIEKRRGVTGDLACLGTWSSKLDGQVLRLSALMHVAHLRGDGTSAGKVTGEAMRAAIRLADYFIAHARRAFDVMDDTAEMVNARKVLAWIGKQERTDFTKSDVTVAFSGRLRAEELAPVLDLLREHEYVRSYTERTTGRPVEVFEVNPSMWRRAA